MVLFSVQFSALDYFIFSIYTNLNFNRMFSSTFQIFLQRGSCMVWEINMGVCPRLDFENIMLFNCLGYNFNIYDAFEFLCNSIASLWRHEWYHYNTLGYPVIIISKVIEISCNRRRNVLLNSYIIDKFAVTENGSVCIRILGGHSFLAHLSRRLMGELIVYQSLRRPSVVRPSVRPQFQTSSPLKPLGQLNSNYIWRLLGTRERKFVRMVLVTWPRWPPRPYMVKTL